MRKILSILCLSTSFVQAQFNDIPIIRNDLIFLTEQYISPAAEASVYQASSGWYTNFTPKDKFDIEISVQYNSLFIPKKSKTFFVNENNGTLQNIAVQGSATTAEIPTALGGDDVVVLEGHIGDETFEFDAPEGIGQESVKHGQIQVTIGLWEQTNLIFRYAPNININDVKYTSFGLGVAHNLNQWIKPLRESSFNFGTLITYSSFSVEDEFNEADLILATINAIEVEGQSFSFNLVGSRSIKQFDFSAALGLTSTKFEYKVGGSNKLDDFDVVGYLNEPLESLNDSEINFKADLNVNYCIKDFSINTMLTFGQYANLNMGISYNID